MGRRKSPEFGQFWQAYPIRKDRIGAERAWGCLTAADRTAAVAGIPAYRGACRRSGVAMMWPQGYLSHRRWEDDDAMAPPAAVTGEALEDMETW